MNSNYTAYMGNFRVTSLTCTNSANAKLYESVSGNFYLVYVFTQWTMFDKSLKTKVCDDAVNYQISQQDWNRDIVFEDVNLDCA